MKILNFVFVISSPYQFLHLLFQLNCDFYFVLGAHWRSGRTSDSEPRGSGFDPQLAAPCFALEQGTLTPQSTCLYTESGDSVPT